MEGKQMQPYVFDDLIYKWGVKESERDREWKE